MGTTCSTELPAAIAIDDAPPCLPRLATPPLADPALHGRAGDVVRAMRPYTEAADAAVLLHLLVALGVAMGRHAYVTANNDRHYAALYALVLGGTSDGKGSAWAAARPVIAAVTGYEDYARGGLSTAEGLIHALRDPSERRGPDGKPSVDEGITDKRRFCIEPEFAGPLRRMANPGNTLSVTLRKLYDDGWDETTTKLHPERCTDAHVGLIAHGTVAELMAELPELHLVNGLINRFLVTLTSRARVLPEGDPAPEELIDRLARPLRAAVTASERRGRMFRTPAADEMWTHFYRAHRERPGGTLYAALTKRGNVHVLRLSLLYALLDDADRIDVPHLAAALAVWNDCEHSFYAVWGRHTGRPMADRILARLAAGPLPHDALAEACVHGRDRGQYLRELQTLERDGLIVRATIPTAGRSRTEWRLSGTGDPA